MKYILILVSTFMFSQTENKIKFNYLSFGAGIYKQQHYKNDGLTTNIDLSIRYNKNFVILYLAGGLGGNDNQKSIFFIDALSSYSEFDLLYGREFIVTTWFKPEVQIGVGIFTHNNSILEDSKNTIGFPIRAKLLFYPAKKFATGFNPNYNINNINHITSYNLIFQFKF